VEGKQVANQSARAEIYLLFSIRFSVGARGPREDRNRLWPISASPWSILGSLATALPFQRTPTEMSVVTSKGQLVIPARLRRRLGIKKGT
jgi:hypothetical protein